MQSKILLREDQLPKQWYNVIPDLIGPLAPVVHPGTLQPVTPDDLLPLFPMGIIEQEVSEERWIDIPQEVLDIYKLWRPAPMFRAHQLEKALGTPAKIYYKYEGVSPAGSHKPNTAVPQAYYNKIAGTTGIVRNDDAVAGYRSGNIDVSVRVNLVEYVLNSQGGGKVNLGAISGTIGDIDFATLKPALPVNKT